MVSDSSDGSDWGIVAALIVWLAFASFISWDANQNEKPTIYCDGPADAQNCRPHQYLTERSGIASGFERAISNAEPRTGQDHEKRDLAAQEASAVFAFWMVLISGFGAVVTTLATVLLYQQIRLTREAVVSTVDATGAMKNANEIAAAANRAWIDIQPSLTVRELGNSEAYFNAQATFTNIGKSVAKSLRAQSKFHTGTFGEAIETMNTIYRKLMNDSGNFSLMPEKSRRSFQRQNRYTKDRPKWSSGRKSVFCIVAVAVYSVEGESRKRHSRAIWFYKPAGTDFHNIAEGMTWEEFISGDIEIDLNSHFDCS